MTDRCESCGLPKAFELEQVWNKTHCGFTPEGCVAAQKAAEVEQLRASLAAARKAVETGDRFLGLLSQRLTLENGGRYLLTESEAAAADDHYDARAELARVMGVGH